MNTRSIVGLFNNSRSKSPSPDRNSSELSNIFLRSRSPLINSSTIDGSKVMLPEGGSVELSLPLFEYDYAIDSTLETLQNVSRMYSQIMTNRAMKEILHTKIGKIINDVSPFVCRENLLPVYYVDGNFCDIRFKDLVDLKHFVILSTNVEISLFYAIFDDKNFEKATLTKIATYDHQTGFKSAKHNDSIKYSFIDLSDDNLIYNYEEKLIYNGRYAFNILNTVFLFNEETKTIM